MEVHIAYWAHSPGFCFPLFCSVGFPVVSLEARSLAMFWEERCSPTNGRGLLLLFLLFGGGFLFSFWIGLDLQATRRTWGAWTEGPGEGLTQTCCPHKSSGMSGGLPCHQKMVYLMGHGIRSACSSQNFCPEAYLVEISFLVFSKFQLSWWASNGLTRKELKPCANILTPNSENVSNQPDYQKMVGRRLREI